jgi:hypothetical protein
LIALLVFATWRFVTDRPVRRQVAVRAATQPAAPIVKGRRESATQATRRPPRPAATRPDAPVAGIISGEPLAISTYYPLVVARTSAQDDPALVQLIEQLAPGPPGSAPPRDNAQLEQTGEKIVAQFDRTPLDAPSLARLGLALFDEERDRFLGVAALVVASKRAQAELAQRTPPDPSAEPLVNVLRKANDLMHFAGNRQDVSKEISSVLMKWEPPGSVARFHATNRYAWLLGKQGNEPEKAIAVMDGLKAEIDRGVYPMFSRKTLAHNYGTLCQMAGRPEAAADFYRDLIEKQNDKDPRTSFDLIVFLAAAGKVQEADQRLKTWTTDFGQKSPADVRELNEIIASARQRVQQAQR